MDWEVMHHRRKGLQVVGRAYKCVMSACCVGARAAALPLIAAGQRTAGVEGCMVSHAHRCGRLCRSSAPWPAPAPPGEPRDEKAGCCPGGPLAAAAAAVAAARGAPP
jgi:hypothetical protein